MIVIDASAVVNVLVDDPACPTLLAMIADEELHAPSLIDYEVASALRGHAQAGLISDRRLNDALDDLRELALERHPLGTMIRQVLGLRHNYTAYDASYIVLAAALDAALVTADAKLSGARALGVDVIVIESA